MTETNQTYEVDGVTAASVAYLQHATPALLRALEGEVPTMAAAGPERCAELGNALDGLRALDIALRNCAVTDGDGKEAPATLDGVAEKLTALAGTPLPAGLAEAVKVASAGVEALRKFDAETHGTPEDPGTALLKAALLVIPKGDLVAGDDETWEAALELAPKDATTFLSFDTVPETGTLTTALAKRGAAWLVEVENSEANRAWLSLLARVFNVKSWPRDNKILACSFAPACNGIEWLDSEMRVDRVVKAEAAEAAAPEERFVLGIVLEPETVDSQKDIYSAEEVRQAAHKFMEEFGNVGLMHKVNVNGKVKILETYLTPCDCTIGKQDVKEGTWMLAVRVVDDELWKAVKSGDLAGFSIGGSAIRRPERRASA